MHGLFAILIIYAAFTSMSSAQEEYEGLLDSLSLSNVTSAELNLFSEAAEYLLELHHFFTEYERLKAQSKAEDILQDAFQQAFINVAAIAMKADVSKQPDIMECVIKVEEEIDQTLDEIRSLLGNCYDLETNMEEEMPKNSSDTEEDQEETLQKEVAEFLQVALLILEIMSEDTAIMIRQSDHLRKAISQHAIMLARNFQRTRLKVRNCVNLEFEEAYKQADRVAAEAAQCLLLDEIHDEL